MPSPFLLLLALLGASDALASADRFASAQQLAAQVNARLAQHWQDEGVQPAPLADDATILRRLTLDLAGRIPTYHEAVAFAADRSPDKRAQAVRRLLASPEYALHLGRVLDEMIQGKYAGDADFLAYLRAAVAARQPWERTFRDILLGPWDTPERKRAERFLVNRLNSLDDLTNDTARVFFGVNVSCAKCHDHPLVADWTQDHYYGMASFFHRTYEAAKAKGRGKGPLTVTELTTGEVTFATTKGQRRTARMMFLSGSPLDESPAAGDGPDRAAAPPGRREQLVRIALEEKTFFSRAIVNRLWAYFLGRGLVQPVDQMHSANPPVIPGLLEWLADDLAAHGYDLDRLVAGLVSSRVYQLASTRPGEEEGAERQFARASLRPLTPAQYAVSLVLAAGDGSFDEAASAEARTKKYRQLEEQSAGLTKPRLLDPRDDNYQSSAGEALFLSNHAEVQRLLRPAGTNLVARLAAIADRDQMIETAIWTVLGRPAEAEEREHLARWVEERGPDRGKAVGQLVWALLTSAEFRFNH
jgi:hypothetical protein